MQKNWKGIFGISIIIVFTIFLGRTIFLVARALIQGDFSSIMPQLLTGPQQGFVPLLSVICLTLLLFVIYVVIASFIVGSLSEKHFGKVALIRWTLFGLIAGFLSSVGLIIPETNLFFFDELSRDALGFVMLFIVYWLLFKVVRLPEQQLSS